MAQCRGMQEQAVGTDPASLALVPVPQRCSLAVVLSPCRDCSRARRSPPWAVAFNNNFLEVKAGGVCANSFLPQHGPKEPGAGRAACVPVPRLSRGRCRLPAVPVPVGSRQTSGRCDGTATCRQAAAQPGCDGPQSWEEGSKVEGVSGHLAESRSRAWLSAPAFPWEDGKA